MLITIFITGFFFRDYLVTINRLFQLYYPSAWEGRFIAWRPAWTAFLSSPIFGYGLGVSYALFFKFIAPDSRVFWGQRSYNHAHSEWIEFLTEGGILGYICFFILWGFVYYNFFKIYNRIDNNFHKRLILGCGLGMLAFHFHGIFSVSQRMIVTNIPQYALLAISFVIIAYYKNPQIIAKTTFKKISYYYNSWLKKWNKVPKIIKNQGSILAFFLIIFYFYIPWAIGQKQFVDVSSQRKNIFQPIKLEKIKTKRKDIYLMDNLTRQYMQYREYEKALKNINDIEKIIPNYRVNGFLRALAYFHLGKYKESYEGLQKYIEKDNYFFNALSLLHKLSHLYREQDVFLSSLNYIFDEATAGRGFKKTYFYWDFSINPAQTENISFEEITQKEGYKFKVTFSQAYFQQLYNAIHQFVITQFQGRANSNYLLPTLQSLSVEIIKAARLKGYLQFSPINNTKEAKEAINILEKDIFAHIPTEPFTKVYWVENFPQTAKEIDNKVRIDNIWAGISNFHRALR